MALRPPALDRAAVWAGLLAATVLLVAQARRFDFLCDDAFISFRYAENLVRHGELAYNPGERVEGYTNFLWTIAMAVVIAAGGDPAPWSQALGVACSVATLAALVLFSNWWTGAGAPARPRSRAWAVVAPLLLALSAPFAAWSEGGLETALFTLLATSAALLHLAEQVDERRRPWSAPLAALAALTRPEGVLLFAALAVHRLAWGLGRRPRPWRAFLRWTALFAAIFVPYWAWRWAYYGLPLPNTYYARSGPLLWGPGWRYVAAFFRDTHVWIAAPSIALSWAASRRGALRGSLVALVAAAWTVYVAAMGGDFMGLFRFLVPTLPLLALAVQEGLFDAWSLARARAGGPAGNRAAAAGVAMLVALLAGHALHNRGLSARALEVGSRDGVDSIGWLKEFVVQTTAIGRHLRAAWPPGTVIATTAAGALPYHSGLPTIDMLGLSDLHIAHGVAPTSARPGHRRAPPEDYVLGRRPRLFIGHPWITADPPRLSEADLAHWRRRGYVVRTVAVPGLMPPYWSYFEAEAADR